MSVALGFTHYHSTYQFLLCSLHTFLIGVSFSSHLVLMLSLQTQRNAHQTQMCLGEGLGARMSNQTQNQIRYWMGFHCTHPLNCN